MTSVQSALDLTMVPVTKKPKPLPTSLEGSITIPAGQSRLIVPFDRSLLTGTVKIQFELTFNGKTKKSTVKLKPPKVKKG